MRTPYLICFFPLYIVLYISMVWWVIKKRKIINVCNCTKKPSPYYEKKTKFSNK